MKRLAIFLVFALILPAHGQAPSRAPSTITVAPYGQAVLTASGPTTWQIYQIATGIKPYVAGNDLVFSAAPGSYLVIGSNASGSTTVTVTFEAPGGNAPPPVPTIVPPTPTPAPPTPAGPEVGPGGFLYPPNLPPATSQTTGFSASVARAARTSPGDAKVLGLLYGLVAAEIELDGRRAQPRITTFAQAKDVLKKEEASFFSGSALKGLKDAFPQVSSIALAEFAKTGITEGAPLTSAVRANYVLFLRQLSNGFDLAAGIPQYDVAPPPITAQ